MKISQFRDYSELPRFLNAEIVAKVPGVSPSSGYELMYEPGFLILKAGSRMVLPKAKFAQWMKQNTVGGYSHETAYNAGPSVTRGTTGSPRPAQ